MRHVDTVGDDQIVPFRRWSGRRVTRSTRDGREGQADDERPSGVSRQVMHPLPRIATTQRPDTFSGDAAIVGTSYRGGVTPLTATARSSPRRHVLARVAPSALAPNPST